MPLLACVSLAACGGGGASSTPLGGADVPPELLACRARVDQPFSYAEIALRSSRNLGLRRVPDRAGPERNVRLHPDGNRVVFSRERHNNDADSRELFVSTLDGSAPELRLTLNAALDDEPCWSPDGKHVLFASERAGPKSLWLTDEQGTDAGIFLDPPTGGTDGEADWCAATDRIVWSRRDANGRHSLWLVQGDGTGIVQLTNGGATAGEGSGDRAPAFAPDGARVAFVRRASVSEASLCVVDVASGAVEVRLAPQGEVSTPRWSPAMDRLFFGLAEPDLGRATLRLAWIPLAAGQPTLVWPDERWRLEGLDILPGMATAPANEAPVPLDVEQADLQIAAGSGTSGSRSELARADSSEFSVATVTIENREIAGINCRFDLPVADAEDVLELRVRSIARTSRAGGDSKLRMSIYNPVDERFDIVVEVPAPGTSPQTMTFTTSSLRHVTKEKQLRVTVIGDVDPGARTELNIDLVEVMLVRRQR
ncbi:MAG TPA: hypothetical protein VFZ65_16920 [Planctomycetota bacterium]|nr:hypothetical protein [Planctomycetota bacterium]